MEKMLEFLKPSPEDFLKKNITQQQWEEFAAFLKQRSHLYREESMNVSSFVILSMHIYLFRCSAGGSFYEINGWI